MKLEGMIIGNRYEIIEKIGNGGMATVYKAKCKILNRYVAIKVLREEFTTDEEFIRRFNSEAQAAASLTHPNIVSIYDVGQEYNIYYIVMELVQGKTLKQIISKEGVLPWKWSVNIAIQIASALEAAHKNNIVHRDIKPHNIMITEDGIAKVADFGIAKAVSNSTITAFGTTIGSVHYFSPEHARGGYTDAKSDLYSLGVVMYEMLTGKVPFDADTPVSVALKHMQEEPVPPMKVNPSIPYAVNKIILKAMQKDTSLRYGSATEMLKDLSMALKRPDGDFVTEDTVEQNFTRRIPTITDEMEEEMMQDKPKTKIGQFFAEHPKVKIASIVALIILIPVLALIITFNAINLSGAKKVVLPDLVGMNIDDAEAKLSQLKLKSEVIEYQYSDEKEVGIILSQDPKFINNYSIVEGDTIKLVVSKGTEVVAMPKVSGMKFEEAKELLEKLNLSVEKVEDKSTKIEEGIVISQETKEGTQLKGGDKVKIHVSIGSGLAKVVVVPVTGMSEEKAKTTLTELGLEVNITTTEDTTKSDGIVLSQSITSGTTVEEGTAITITVNRWAQVKEGTVNINLKSLTSSGNYDDTVKVLVKVVSENAEDTVYNQTVSADTENLNLTVQGKRTITVKVYINDALKKTGTINLESSNTVLSLY